MANSSMIEMKERYIRQVFYVELIREAVRDYDSFDLVVVFQSLDEIFDSKFNQTFILCLTDLFPSLEIQLIFVDEIFLIDHHCYN